MPISRKPKRLLVILGAAVAAALLAYVAWGVPFSGRRLDERVFATVDPSDQQKLTDSQIWKIDMSELGKEFPQHQKWDLVVVDAAGGRRLVGTYGTDRSGPGRFLIVEAVPLPFGWAITEADSLLIKAFRAGAIMRMQVANPFQSRSAIFQGFLHESGIVVLGSAFGMTAGTPVDHLRPAILLEPEGK